MEKTRAHRSVFSRMVRRRSPRICVGAETATVYASASSWVVGGSKSVLRRNHPHCSGAFARGAVAITRLQSGGNHWPRNVEGARCPAGRDQPRACFVNGEIPHRARLKRALGLGGKGVCRTLPAVNRGRGDPPRRRRVYDRRDGRRLSGRAHRSGREIGVNFHFGQGETLIFLTLSSTLA